LNYIILLKPNVSFYSLLTLNVIIQNIEKMSNDHFKIILLHSNKHIENSIYFNKKKFDKNIKYYEIKRVYNLLIEMNTSISEKTIIDISESFYGKIINFLIKKKNKKQYFQGKVNFFENDELLEKLKDKLNYKNRPIKKPIEYVDKVEIKKTLEYINWNMKTSGHKELKKIRYIYIILENENFNSYVEELEIIGKFCDKKSNLKTIFTLTNINPDENENIRELMPEKIKKTMIGDEFINCEKNFILNLIQNSRFVITDNKSCNFYCDKIDKDCLFFELITKNSKEFKEMEYLNSFENKTSFLIKNCV
tara:strand:+ start:800 stop:1720 length:921 start_codon:yes stop_codon:yes gene_type:complete